MLQFLITVFAVEWSFNYLWNVASIPIGLPMSLLLPERHVGSFATVWQFGGVAVLSSVLVAVSSASAGSGVRLWVYLAICAVTIWYWRAAGAVEKLRRGQEQGDRSYLESGEREVRLSWLSPLILLAFAFIPALVHNPVSGATLHIYAWAVRVTVIRWVMVVAGLLAALDCVANLALVVPITAGALLWSNRRPAGNDPTA